MLNNFSRAKFRREFWIYTEALADDRAFLEPHPKRIRGRYADRYLWYFDSMGNFCGPGSYCPHGPIMPRCIQWSR